MLLEIVRSIVCLLYLTIARPHSRSRRSPPQSMRTGLCRRCTPSPQSTAQIECMIAFCLSHSLSHSPPASLAGSLAHTLASSVTCCLTHSLYHALAVSVSLAVLSSSVRSLSALVCGQHDLELSAQHKIELLCRASDLNPYVGEPHVLRAQILAQEGLWKEAIAATEQALVCLFTATGQGC